MTDQKVWSVISIFNKKMISGETGRDESLFVYYLILSYDVVVNKSPKVKVMMPRLYCLYKKCLVLKSFLLFSLLSVFLGCGDEPSNQDQVSKDLVKELPVVDRGPEKEIVWEKDGQEMILIPAGSFEMGDSKNEPEEWMADTRPLHTVTLDAFYMDIHEVTVGQFKHFVTQTGYNYKWWDDVAELSPTDGHPMTIVKWTAATAYADWAGKRLPTEAEWEYAARGGLEGKRYPWGDDLSLATDYANYKGTGGKDRWKYTAPVGSFEPNGYGLYDMAGNVWEWCQDWYDENYYSNSPGKNPLGPDSSPLGWRILRGGSWRHPSSRLRVACRDHYPSGTTDSHRGFRCVADIQ